MTNAKVFLVDTQDIVEVAFNPALYPDKFTPACPQHGFFEGQKFDYTVNNDEYDEFMQETGEKLTEFLTEFPQFRNSDFGYMPVLLWGDNSAEFISGGNWVESSHNADLGGRISDCFATKEDAEKACEKRIEEIQKNGWTTPAIDISFGFHKESEAYRFLVKEICFDGNEELEKYEDFING